MTLKVMTYIDEQHKAYYFVIFINNTNIYRWCSHTSKIEPYKAFDRLLLKVINKFNLPSFRL